MDGMIIGVASYGPWGTFRLPTIYFWATVCKTVGPMLSDRCLSYVSVSPLLSCLSVTLVYCGQKVDRIIVLDGDPAAPPQRDTDPQYSAQVRCGQNGWMA